MSPPICIRAEAALWPRGVARGQGLDINRNRVAIALRQHRGVGDDVCHRRSDTAVIGRRTGFKHFGDIFRLPLADARRRYAGDVSRHFSLSPTAKVSFMLDGGEDVS